MRAGPLPLAALLCVSACGGIVVMPGDDEAGGDSGTGGNPSTTGPGPVSTAAVGPGASVGTGSGGSTGDGGSTSTGDAVSGSGGDRGTGGGDDCRAAPCVIATGFVGMDIDQDGERIYATTGNDGTVVGLPKAGGATEVIAESDGYAESLALYDGTLFWGGEDSVFRVPAAGGAPSIVVTPGLPIGAIAIGGADLYFVDRQAFGSVRAVPTTGGDVRVVIPYASLANDVAFVRGIKNWDTLLWVSTDAAVGELHALVLDGTSAPTTLLGGMDTPGAILSAIEGTYVTEPYAGIVSRVVPSGIGEFLVGTVDLPLGIAIDDTYLYITESGTHDAHSGRILRMGRFEATGIEVMAENLHAPRGIVADDEALYWLEGDPERSVMRLAKPAP